jgi:putative alpha-1,2-mannosidase
MGSLYAFSAMGIFPVAGQPIYLIGTPLFSTSTLTLANGRTFTIEARNVSDKNIYITSASLNDEPLNQAWLRHADLMAGGKLTLEMGPQPGTWPTGPVPPSPLSN